MPHKIILAGNPNVGKSTIFNALTGLRQHTGNWSGKTVGCARGLMADKEKEIIIIDTPGTYSLSASSPDEISAAEIICNEKCNHIVYVCDACCLEKSLYLLFQIMEKRSGIIVCLNLMDEAERKGISIDVEILSKELSLPVIPIVASRNIGIGELRKSICEAGISEIKEDNTKENIIALKNKASEITKLSTASSGENHKIPHFDRLLCSKIFGIPTMLMFLFALLWISISAANIPSSILSLLFARLGGLMRNCALTLGIPPMLISAILDGIYGTVAWVISVMLPPIAIFFPLFTLMEDLGLLPRIAFNADPIFKCCGSCGKQALGMCMGLGCNAVGVSACRIIPSPKQKLISIMTNSFMPCNGRFPTIILLASILFPDSGFLLAPFAVMSAIILGIIATLISTKFLSKSLGNEEFIFTLELPPYRKPKIIKTLVHSFYNQSAKVLIRAIKASAPAGLLIWFLINVKIADASLSEYICNFLDAPAAAIGLSGTILFAFILGLPANEIVMPIILMCYLQGSSLMVLPESGEMRTLLQSYGWTNVTAICTIIFTLFHWPCATTLMTIKKECAKIKYVLFSIALPCFWGVTICFLINFLAKII